MGAAPVRLFTPLVLGATAAVVALGIVRAVLFPEAWLASLSGILFLPLVLAVLGRRRRHLTPERARKTGAPLRAGIVGAAVLLSTAFALEILEALGIKEASEGGAGIVALLPAIVAMAADLLGARLEQAAEREEDGPDAPDD